MSKLDNPNCGGYTDIYIFIKTHQTTHIKWVHFILCKLYLDLAQSLEKLELGIKSTMKDLN